MSSAVGQLKAQRAWIIMADLFLLVYYMNLGAQMLNVCVVDRHPEKVPYQ